MYALGPAYFGIAFVVNDTSLYTAALHFGQGVQGVPEVEKAFRPQHQFLRGRLMQTGRILNAVIAVERILCLVSGNAAAVSGLIPLIGLQLFRYFIGNFDIFIMSVPSIKVFQIDGSHYIFLRSEFLWVGR